MKAENEKTDLQRFLRNVRAAFGDYYRSEGCECCQDGPAHKAAEERLAKLLRVPKYKDGSGYDFRRFATREGS